MSDQEQPTPMYREQQPLPVAVCLCGKKYRIREGWSGKTISCKSCGQKLLLTVSSASDGHRELESRILPQSSSIYATDSPSKEGSASWTKSAATRIAWGLSWCKLHTAEVLGSVVIHGGAGLILLSLLLEHQEVPDLKPLSAAFESKEIELQEVEQIVLADLSDSDSLPAETPAPLTQLSASVLPPSESFENQTPELRFEAPAVADSVAEAEGENGSMKKGRSRGAGDGEGNGNGGTTFFGKKLSVDSIAYVIDASGSMQGARFQRARMELANALMQMKKTQRFFIVFYTDQTYPLFWPDPVLSLLPASPGNLRKTGLWLERAQTSGGTEPQEAMRLALSLEPDVVFLLSDGDIPEETQVIVSQMNKGSIIHTLALGSDTGAMVLQRISAENQGEFRFIPDIP
jgi:hypothetical protein